MSLGLRPQRAVLRRTLSRSLNDHSGSHASNAAERGASRRASLRSCNHLSKCTLKSFTNPSIDTGSSTKLAELPYEFSVSLGDVTPTQYGAGQVDLPVRTHHSRSIVKLDKRDKTLFFVCLSHRTRLLLFIAVYSVNDISSIKLRGVILDE